MIRPLLVQPRVSSSVFSAVVVMLFVSILHALPVHAQANYVEGFVITLEGDSLEGLIDFQEWNKGPSRIRFKDTSSGPVRRFSPDEISGFHVSGGDRYVSRILTIDQAPVKIEKALTAPEELPVTRDTVFLAVLVAGPAQLFYYRDFKDHFFLQYSGRITELIMRRQFEYRGNRKVFVTDNAFQNQLRALFDSCPIAREKAERARFISRDLKNAVVAFNECVDPNSVSYVRSEPKPRVMRGAILGFSRADMTVRGRLFPIDNHPSALYLNSSVNLTAGVSLGFRQARNRRRWGQHNELVLTAYEVNGPTKTESGRVEDVNFRASYVKLAAFLRRYFVGAPLEPFIQAGIGNSLLLSYDSKAQIRNHTGGLDSREAMSDPRKHEQSLLLGAGMQFRKFSAEARMEYTNGFSPYAGLSTRLTHTYLIVGYQF